MYTLYSLAPPLIMATQKNDIVCRACGGKDHQRTTSKKCRFYRPSVVPTSLNDATSRTTCVSCGQEGHLRNSHKDCPDNTRNSVSEKISASLSKQAQSVREHQRQKSRVVQEQEQDEELATIYGLYGLPHKEPSQFRTTMTTATTSIDIDLDLSPSLDTDGDPAHLNPPTSDPCNVSMEELPQVDLPLAAARDHETVEYKSLGRMDRTCPHCQAQLWLEERLVASSSLNPKFSICYGQGAVRLTPLSVPPDGLRELFKGRTSNSKRFLANTRSFNSAFAFVSLGCKVDNKFPGYRGPPTFRIHGELYHRIGSLIPPSNQDPVFSQIYFYDSSYDSQVARRLQFIRQRGQRYQTNMNDRNRDRDRDIIIKLQEIMSTVNPYAKQFKYQGDRFRPTWHREMLAGSC
ncbi:MAG: hypothetical protein J3Q66DRAFT_344374 [Benniella sp.]|nr:MAG: hypothetical protein J3Q66DRAFT_344374 [Benniella sp.]